MSPTTIFQSGTLPRCTVSMPGPAMCGGEGVPGVVRTGVAGRVYYRVLPSHPPRTHIQSLLASGPYPRPNEEEFSIFMRFPRMGLRIGPELTQNDPRIDPRYDPPDWSPDGLQMTLSDLPTGLSQTAVLNKALFDVLLTIADRNRVSSRDWIRPPSRCQK